jgi:hypothetical protein
MQGWIASLLTVRSLAVRDYSMGSGGEWEQLVLGLPFEWVRSGYYRVGQFYRTGRFLG